HNGFGSAEHEIPVRRHLPGDPVEHVDFRLLIKVNQHVAAEYDVVFSESDQAVEKIELPPLNHRTKICVDLPEISLLREVFQQHLDRQAALDFELAIDACPRPFEYFVRQIGSKNVEAPACD